MPRSFAADVWSGLLFLAIGTAFALGALRYPIGTPASMEPGFFPLLLGALLASLGVALTFKGVAGASDPVLRPDLRISVTVIAAIVLFGLLLNHAGLVLSTMTLIAIASRATTGFRPRALIVTGVLLTGFVATLFVAVLDINIPLWPSF